ncbi:molybdopterin-dependent oxidoreductase [Halocynthiibacter sp. C4]|uniref:xanthine dehydrogenase family protein molybdopterin-binding subunit n=1 Tax=Halocynthiibacter sp. C4 TaxID=2992758 RepID=UPI00237A1E70|nr:molybdopterin cofactor-binding domain-containing protein [Halocynthiibacter sp. C4]MDE0589978.1 molybdopterin-dependent oxidoreductase [Halocynthiibacter sp. C4]
MSRIGKIARRTFLIGSVAVVGGVAFGYYTYKKPIKNPLLDDLADGEAALTPYVRIDQSGVTIITPRADLGQGAYSIQAALVAEELDVDPSAVNVDPGPPSAAYYNSKIAGEGLPFSALDESTLASSARDFGEGVAKVLGIQITGGSSTVPDAYEKLRIAGAVARETLKAAAAKETGVAVSELQTRDGHVILPDGTEIAYADLAATAASIEPIEKVQLRDAASWERLGKSHERLDIVAKSTGTLPFGIDLEMDGMLYASVRTNPRMGGEVLGFDATEAEGMRGVLKVVPIKGGAGVIADNTWRAIQAVNAIEFDWGEAPYPAEQDALWEATRAAINSDQQDSRFKDEGNVEPVLAEGGVLEAEYRIPYLAHAPLEPMNAVVQLKDGRLDIWTGTQIPRFLVAKAAKTAGIEAENVHLHNQYMGGSFGRRLEDEYVQQAVELAVAHQGAPIKMTWSREEDMTHDFPRPMQVSRARGKVQDGKVHAYDLAIAASSTSESQIGRLGFPAAGPDIAIVQGAWDQPFAIPNYRVTGYRAPAMVPVSSWRSVGASGNGFLHGGFLDELFQEAGADPLAEMLRLCNHDASRKVIETVGEMANWGSDLGANRGRGLAFCVSFGVPTAEVVEITQTESGIKIDKVFVALDVGKVLDPVNFDNQVKGGVIWGLGHAMLSELTYSDGRTEQENYDWYEAMRLYQAPEIFVQAVDNGSQIRGVGEPAVPPAAPALANAIFDATGQRIRELPLSKHIDFV